MQESGHSTERIITILKEAEAGMSVAEVCRKYGISDATYYDWKEKYGGMTSAGTKRLGIWRMRAVSVRTLYVMPRQCSTSADKHPRTCWRGAAQTPKIVKAAEDGEKVSRR